MLEILCFVIFLFYYLHLKSSKRKPTIPPKLHYKKNRLNNAIIGNCTRLTSSFTPSFYARISHIQTLMNMIGVAGLPKTVSKREFLQMQDGGIVSLDWFDSSNDNNDKFACPISFTNPILILCPGLFPSDFQSIVRAALKQGYRPVIINMRGHRGTPLNTQKLATLCELDDITEIIEYIHQKYKYSDLVAIGYSFGAISLLGYLGIHGKASLLTAAVCVSTTLDLNQLFTTEITQPYGGILLEMLKAYMLSHPLSHSTFDIHKAVKSNSLCDLYEKALAQLTFNQYKSFSEYVNDNNPLVYAKDISVPVLFVNALDDPVIKQIPSSTSVFTTVEYFIQVCTDYGGHCGFYEGSIPCSWSNTLAMEFFEVVFEFRGLIIEPNIKNGFYNRTRSITR